MKKLLFLILLPVLASAQANFGSPFVFAGVPSGTCASNQLAVNSLNGNLYTCFNGVWTAVGAFPDLTDTAGVLITSTVPILYNGAASTTAASFQLGASARGVYFGSTVTVGLGVDATTMAFMTTNSGGAFAVNSASALGFGTGAGFTNPDTGIRRRSAANFSLGIAIDVNGVPVAQTLSMQNAITGSNLTGANFTLAGSLGTGTGTPALLNFTGGAIGTSGTTAQVGISRLALNDTKQLTSGAATTVVSVPIATLQVAGGTIDYHLEAFDGTNQCTRDGQMSYSSVNSAGVFVTQVTNAAGANDSTACTATKTLTLAWAATGANPTLIQVTPTLGGITPTTFQIVYNVSHKGQTQPTL